jgi:serine/threonine-protein kinase
MSGLPNPGDLVASRYRIEAEIGRGAMGVVFRARDPGNQAVAIKVLLPEAIDAPGATERFTNESQAARILTNEHAVKVFDAGALDNALPYMVMELLEGVDFESLLEKRDPLPVAEASDVVIEACAALAEAHGHGMVHRDLKPGNLFAARCPDGRTRVKVLDFGLSKVAAQMRQVALTSTGTMLGTPYYMAPEQLRSAKGADHRADVWSLGVILYEFVTKTVPFDGSSFGMLFGKIITEEPKPLASVRPDVPAGFAEVVHRCLKKNRDDRYADVTALAMALAPFASPTGVAAAKGILAGRAPAGPVAVGKKGGTMLMAGPPTSANRISVAPPVGQGPLPTPPSVVPHSVQRPPTPGAASMAPVPPQMSPMNQMSQMRPAHAPQPPAAAPLPAPAPAPAPAPPAAQPSPKVIVALACVFIALAVIGIILYLLSARGGARP